ncbi:Z1 domain-containing protein [Dyella humi]|uniref:Z1 domain-containing protein n=1 Tax=Dyella humi TaxID=1770547 RepID=A0ABW8IKU6_9GAMM
MLDTSSSLTPVLNIAQTLLEVEKGKQQAITPLIIAEKVDHATAVVSASLSDADREFIIAELIRRFSHWIGRDSALEDTHDHIAWLVSERKKDWRYWQRYQTMLERKLSVSVVEALDKSTDGILSKLEDPTREGNWDRRGLVVGHVQSGKTGNYSGLVCKAADAGYKVIIVLAGLHNNLRSQTQIRLEESFLGYETSENRDRGTPVGVGLIDSDPRIHPNCATTRADNGDFNAGVARQFAISPEQRPWLFVVKKQKTVLTQLLKWIRGHVADSTDAATGRKIVTNLPLLVIDDEADNASVDTGEQVFDSDGVPDDEHQPTAINSLIRKIIHSFAKSAYVGYTATPFANIFIHRRGATNEEGLDLFPQSFIINLAAPSNYVGPARVFGLSSPEGRSEGLPLTSFITDHVKQEAPDHPDGWMPGKHKKDHVPLFDGQAVPPPSLIKAIHSFVLACAARKCRGQGREHSSMLIHVTRFTSVQGEVREQVEAVVNSMRQKLTHKVDHQGLLSGLRQLWEEDFVPTSQVLQKPLESHGERLLIPEWAAIAEVLPDVVRDIIVRVVNGTAKDALDYSDQSEVGLKVIAIGGDKLARGLTLEGLCTSYFVRTTKMYDTLMQMGRWFGYRPGYLDLCRLYTSEDLVEWFKHIADASEELREEFDAMAERGDTPENYGLRVQSHSVLLVTSPLKMRTSKELQLSFSGELLETVSLFKTDVRLTRNLTATEDLIRGMGQPNERNPTRMRAGNESKWTGSYLWKGVSADLIADFFGNYLTHPDAHKVKSNLLADFVRQMARSNELTSWTVVMIGGGEGRPHRFGNDIYIDMLKRKDETSGPEKYSIGRLLSPRDEAIDLDDDAWQAALSLTIRTWEATGGKRSSRPSQPEVPNGPAVRRIRGKGAAGVTAAPERGLLLLYALDPCEARPSDALNHGFENDDLPVIAFGVSFPSSDNGVKVTYQVDHLRWEQEYGAGE